MKKLKTISQFSKLTLLLFLLAILYTVIKVNVPLKSKYPLNTKKIEGYVYACQSAEDKTTLKVKGKENILINYYDNEKCILGQKIKAVGKIKVPSENTNFYLFNYKNYLLSKKINYTFTATNLNYKNAKIPIIYKIKNILNNHVQTYKSFAYLKALVLGDDNSINEEAENSYQANGISHLLAISGAQITLFATALLFIFNKFLSKNLSYTLTITILVFYLFITNFEPSILRATVFFIILTINKQFELKIETINLLIITLNILLIYNPFYIYSLGFILSFTVSFYLVLFTKLINKYQNYISKTLVISLIAFLASSPIIINTSFSLNLLAPLINLYFVPLITFIIYPLAILTFIFKPLDNIFLKFVTIMENASIKLSNINCFTLTLAHINIFVFILYYTLITIILYKWLKGKNYILVFFVILIFHHYINYLNPNASFTMLDVGQGDSLLLKLENSKANILIDTGGLPTYDDRKPYNISQNITIPYLKAEGINQLDYLIITHGDYDHMGEAINLINNFKIKKVIFNNNEYNTLEKNLIKLLDKKKIKYYHGLERLNIGQYKMQFLNTKTYDNENDNSNVIYFNYHTHKFLLMGDASAKKEQDILKKYNIKNIDFLKVGHHGSDSSSSKNFINKINPQYSLISVGQNNRYGHPKKRVLKTLSNSKIYRTDKNGAIKIQFKKNKYQIKTCK